MSISVVWGNVLPSMERSWAGSSTWARLVQSSKTQSSNMVSDSGNLMLESAVHPLKAMKDIFSMVSGKSIDVRLVHPSKAPMPISFNPLGRFTSFKLVAFPKNEKGMISMFSGSVALSRLEHPENMLSFKWVIDGGIVISLSLEQPLKASDPNPVRPSGRVMSLNNGQDSKALDCISFSELGSFTDTRLGQC